MSNLYNRNYLLYTEYVKNIHYFEIKRVLFVKKQHFQIVL